MSQEQRLLLAIVISVFVFVGYAQFFAPPPPAMDASQMVTPQAAAPAPKKVDVSDKVIVSAAELKAQAQDIVVTTAAAHAVIDTKGGVLKSYELKDYHIEASKESPLRNLLTESQGSRAFFLGLKGYSRLDHTKVYEVVSDEVLSSGEHQVILRWYDENIEVQKTFRFGGKASDYALEIDYAVLNKSTSELFLTPYVQTALGQKPIAASQGFLSFLDFQPPDQYAAYALSVEGLSSYMDWQEDFAAKPSVNGAQWSALSDRYFSFVVLPADVDAGTAQFERQGNAIMGSLQAQQTTLASGAKASGQFVGYIGPKMVSELKQVAPDLELLVDYGFFSIVARPILWLMQVFQKFLVNWGLVIIALTFFIKLLLHPVNKKSMMAMKAMQQLQPKLKELREKHGNDKQKQQEEMMHLFRTHKVNPVGGCLPMVLQMPIYIALYQVLWNTFELYHAPFLFYADLSAPDPYYISPILLGVFMFLQQKLTPTATMEPAQQKMMMIMPLMFTVFMLFLPVGLVIYIFVNTVVSVLQQYMIKNDLRLRDLIRGKWQPNGA